MTATSSQSKKRRLVDVLATIFTPAVVIVPFLEWIPFIPEEFRWILVWALVALALAGWIAGLVRNHRHDKEIRRLRNDLDAAQARLDTVTPGHTLDHITGQLFGTGAWRLSFYSKITHDSDGECLDRQHSVASDHHHAEGAPARIILRPSLFAEIFQTNLADPRGLRAFESGGFADRASGKGWSEWRYKIFGGSESVPDDTSTMPTRKFAWYAAQDPDTARIVVAIAESASPTGINIDYLNSAATSAWLILVTRMAEVGAQVTPVLDEGADLVRNAAIAP